jgi:serine/threonine protein kinase
LSDNSKLVGSGTSSSVFKCYNLANKEMVVAVKIIDKTLIHNDKALVAQEIFNLREIDHPGIVKYYETYDDNKFLYICTEYIHGLTIFQ